MRGRIGRIIVVALLAAAVAQAGGTVTTTTFWSDALGTNKAARVYLPEGYESSGLNYPVVYLLHGNSGGNPSWNFTELQPALDEMIAGGLIDPVIVIEPNALHVPPPQEWQAQGFTDFIWSFHTNSELTGRHEDFLSEDMVEWVDSTYRTQADREHRWLLGRSMGGHGAIRLALRHADVFSAASIDAGFMAAIEGSMKYIPSVLVLAGQPPYSFAPTDNFYSEHLFALCAAFTPNMDNPPWYVDFLLDENGEIVDEVHQRLLAQSPPALVHAFDDSEYSLDLFFRIGDEDEYADMFWPVIDALESEGLPHEVRIFEGDHGNPPLSERLPIHLTYLVPIKATAEISPRVADPRLSSARLRVALELPGALEASDIDCTSLEVVDIDGNRLACPVSCHQACEISDLNGNGRDDLSVWLPCAAVIRAALTGGASCGDQVTLTVRGELEDGRFFTASDSVTLTSDPTVVDALD